MKYPRLGTATNPLDLLDSKIWYERQLLEYFVIDPDYIIMAGSQRLYLWRWVILIASFYCAIYVPLELSFSKERLYDPGVITLDVFIDMLFIADFVLQFFISFTDSKTRLVIEGPLIAHDYIGSKRFYYDLLPFLFGARWMSEADIHMKLFRILKLANAMEIASSRRNNLTKIYAAIGGIARLMIIIGLYMHIIACYYYMVTLANSDKVSIGHPLNESKQWYAPTYFMNFVDQKLFTDEIPATAKYLKMFYYSTMFLG